MDKNLYDSDYIESIVVDLITAGKTPTKLLMSQDVLDEFSKSFYPIERRTWEPDLQKMVNPPSTEGLMISKFYATGAILEVEVVEGTNFMEVS